MAHYATTDPNPSERELKHRQMGREIAHGGMVLLKNDGCLPLKSKRVAIYGAGARHTVYGGLGAAGVVTRGAVSIEGGLKQAGYMIANEDFQNKFDDVVQASEDEYYSNLRKKSNNNIMLAVVTSYAEPYALPELPVLTDAEIPANTDTAIFVVSRDSGEGADRSAEEYSLSTREKENLRFLVKKFEHVIVLLNVAAVMDASFVDEIPEIGAVLMMSQGGILTGTATTDVLSGAVTPSGKLASTWAKKYEDYPACFLKNPEEVNDLHYKDGIFVGYRYFDSFGVEPVYPFGFGLSYTSFNMKTVAAEACGTKICLHIDVSNTGDTYAGREVVQVYVSAPTGKLVKAYQDLKGFKKTKLLQPGETERVTVEIESADLASYSINDASWVLEPGRYLFRVGNSSRNTVIAAYWDLSEEKITQKCERAFVTGDSVEEMVPPPYSTENIPAEAIAITLDSTKIETVVNVYNTEHSEMPHLDFEVRPTLQDVIAGRVTLEELIGQMTNQELAYLCVGSDAERGRESPDFVLDDTPGANTGTSRRLGELGVPQLMVADGAAGLRVTPEFEVDAKGRALTSGLMSITGMNKAFPPIRHEGTTMYYQYTTQIPMPFMLAQTWDTDAVEKAGAILAAEMEWLHIGLWLAPSLNIHRDPLCGRNFEYYSEDPLISGLMAAHETLGLQASGKYGVTLKHFACNNQETNRSGVSANVTERTLREIYLKGFEIAVRKADPRAIMTSYNLINGIHTANDYELLTRVARCEWGFNGLIMTDWGTTGGGRGRRRPGAPDGADAGYPGATAPGCMAAGNDLVMSGTPGDIEAIVDDLDSGVLALADVQHCAKHILNVILRSFHFALEP